MRIRVYIISRKAIDEIRKFYSNVARKYATTFSSTLMSQNIADAIYTHRIEGNTVYVEDACHAQNMSEFTSISTTTIMPKYRKLTKKLLFGDSFVMNDRKEYNLIHFLVFFCFKYCRISLKRTFMSKP